MYPEHFAQDALIIFNAFPQAAKKLIKPVGKHIIDRILLTLVKDASFVKVNSQSCSVLSVFAMNKAVLFILFNDLDQPRLVYASEHLLSKRDGKLNHYHAHHFSLGV